MAHLVLNRVIRVFNYFALAAGLAALGTLWWYGIRPLPKTSGSIDAPVNATVTVGRDALGTPHVQATSEEDALFAQGYATAQDRLFQMDGLRRLAGGTLAEVLGPRFVELDREARRLRMRRIAEAAYLTLPPADRSALAAYARGVNHFLATRLGALQVEFTLLGYHPRPWSAVDSLLIGLQMYRRLTSSWLAELTKRGVMASGDRARLEYLFPLRTGGEVQPGSNAWAVAGSKTASGKPLLSSDMHLEWALPNLWHSIHLQAPGLDVAGVALPGVPGVIVGHNQRIAWGITNLEFDVQDLYQEKFDDRSGRYLFRGQVEQARLEREFIEVKGAERVEVLVWVTRHGPLFITEGADRLSLRWAAAEERAVQFPVLDINRAQNWTEFQRAISRFHGPGSNFVYADVDGNIGYHAAGLLPVRRNHRGDVPADGASGEQEWDGFIPFEQLPSAFNPPSGLIVSANQNPFPESWGYPVNGNFSAPYRARQIRDRLQARGGWKAGEMISVQTDIYSGFSRFLASAMVQAYDRRKLPSATLDEAASLLRGWNGQMDQALAAPFIVTLATEHLRRAVVEGAAPGKSGSQEFPLGTAVLEKLFRERPAGWFPDYDGTLLRALSDAVEEGVRMQGRDIKRWRYGLYFKLGLNHPVLHQVPWIGAHFDIQPVPMSGSSTTVKQTSIRVGPSMRMNADAADWERSLLSLPVGESGHVLSAHYRDQWRCFNGIESPWWRRWLGWAIPGHDDSACQGRHAMQFAIVDVRDKLELRPGK